MPCGSYTCNEDVGCTYMSMRMLMHMYLHNRVHNPRMAGHATCAWRLQTIDQISEGMVFANEQFAVRRCTVTNKYTYKTTS